MRVLNRDPLEMNCRRQAARGRFETSERTKKKLCYQDLNFSMKSMNNIITTIAQCVPSHTNGESCDRSHLRPLSMRLAFLLAHFPVSLPCRRINMRSLPKLGGASFVMKCVRGRELSSTTTTTTRLSKMAKTTGGGSAAATQR